MDWKERRYQGEHRPNQDRQSAGGTIKTTAQGAESVRIIRYGRSTDLHSLAPYFESDRILEVSFDVTLAPISQ